MALQGEISQMMGHFPQQDLASLASGVVVEASQPHVEQFARGFVESTFPQITSHLGISSFNLKVFHQRVTNRLREHVDTFMGDVYQTELSQLLEALTTHQPTPQGLLLRQQVDKMLKEGDEPTLNHLKAQIVKHQQRAAEALQKKAQSMAQPQAAPVPQQAAQVIQPNPKMDAAITAAALNGDLTLIQTLLSQGANINGAAEKGWTSLMNASLNGHAHVINFLISSRANLNIRDETGYTALMYAACYQKADCVEALAAAGADLTIKDNSGRDINAFVQNPAIKAALDRGVSRAPRAAPTPAPQATPQGFVQQFPAQQQQFPQGQHFPQGQPQQFPQGQPQQFPQGQQRMPQGMPQGYQRR